MSNSHADKKTAGSILTSTSTTMSDSHLFPEILDHIADLLHDNRQSLKQCCLISKSWLPRTRKHLFACVEFRSSAQFKSWRKMFPAPTNSPAYHARTLRIGRTLGDVGGSGWILGFSRVERLEFELMGLDSPDIPFAVFQELSPSLKSLSITNHSTPACLQPYPLAPPSREPDLDRF